MTTPRHPAQKAGGFDTLAQALDYAAQGQNGLRFFSTSGAVTSEYTYAQLRQHALQMATVLAQKKLPRGSRIALLAETRLEFIALFFACQYLGLLPCPLPFTLFAAGRDAYTQKLVLLLQAAQASLLVTPASIEPVAQAAGEQLQITVVSYEALAQQAAASPALNRDAPLQADDAAYIQFSSGSTSNPTGVLITQRAVAANIAAILREGMQITPEDRAFSWLPYYHDMGLVGFVLAPISGQVPIDYLPPASFARRPALWLELLSALHSTITYAPGFAYALAAKRLDPDSRLDLSALRIAGIGGDMIHAATLKTFAQQMARYGFRLNAFAPSYGLAEATLAVTMTRPNQPPLIKHFTHTGHQQELVSCGPPLPGYEIRIVPMPCDGISPAQPSSPADPVGEIWVKGPSVAAPNLIADQRQTIIDKDGFIATGDLGFVYENQLFVTGRSKDLIIIRGRNIWAQDVEWAVAACDHAIRPQHVCAIGVPDGNSNGDGNGNNDGESEGERLVILVQNHLSDPQQRAQLQQRLLQAVSAAYGVAATVLWVEPHQLTLTSSGKLARQAIRARFLSGTLSIIN